MWYDPPGSKNTNVHVQGFFQDFSQGGVKKRYNGILGGQCGMILLEAN